MSNSSPASRIPSRSASHNTFDESIATSDTSRVSSNMQGLLSTHNADLSSSLSYASALGASLSRSTTPDPQLIARAPSPRIPTTSETRVNSMDKRKVNTSSTTTAGIVAALSGMTLSSDSQIDEERQIRSQFDQRNFLNAQGEFGPFQQSLPHVTKGSYPTKGKNIGVGMDQNYYVGPNSPSNFHGVGSPSSAIPNYSLSGHNINPALASMMAGQLGSGPFPPLFENAAVSAIGVSGLDSRSLGGSLSSRTNLSLDRGGNQSYSEINQNWNPYSGSQLAALSDLSLEGGNSGMDLLALQRAYLGTLLSPQKSECGRPYLGKSGLSHGYYGNQGFGYAGNHLSSSLLPNSSVGPGSPFRHGERNIRMGSGMRNLGVGMMGNWRSEMGGLMDYSFGSLLDEFKSNKAKCFELSEIAGHVVEFRYEFFMKYFLCFSLSLLPPFQSNSQNCYSEHFDSSNSLNVQVKHSPLGSCLICLTT